MTGHEFKPYADYPDLCVAELAETGNTCNRTREEHADPQCYCGYFLSEHNAEARQLARENDDLVPCYTYREWPANDR